MLLRKHGIRHFKSVPYCSWQNGIAERLNRTLLEGARSMLFGKNLPKNLWELAVKYMCYVKNRVPTEKGMPSMILNNGKLRYDLMWPFGCEVWFKLPNVKKLDPKAEKGIYVGVAGSQKGILVLKKSGKVIVTRDFKTVNMGKCSNIEYGVELGEFDSDDRDYKERRDTPGFDVDIITNDSTGSTPEQEMSYDTVDTVSNESNSCEEKPLRIILDNMSPFKPNMEIPRDVADFAFLTAADVLIPRNFQEAMDSQEKEEWIKSIAEELGAIKSHNTWSVVKRDAGFNVLPFKWVFTIKRDQNGTIVRFKARIVVGGRGVFVLVLGLGTTPHGF
jgi:hypothetical protein